MSVQGHLAPTRCSKHYRAVSSAFQLLHATRRHTAGCTRSPNCVSPHPPKHVTPPSILSNHAPFGGLDLQALGAVRKVHAALETAVPREDGFPPFFNIAQVPCFRARGRAGGDQTAKGGRRTGWGWVPFLNSQEMFEEIDAFQSPSPFVTSPKRRRTSWRVCTSCNTSPFLFRPF